MVDFLKISTRMAKKGTIEIFPKFIIGRSNDLMIRGGDFYAIWLEDKGLWSQDEQDVINCIDEELETYSKKYKEINNCQVSVQYMWDSASGVIDSWHKYCQKQMRDNFKPLDSSIIFANQETKKEDYATKKLDYALEEGDITAWEELGNVLYIPTEWHKIEWIIGAIVNGDSKKLAKFMVLYGDKGTGKSTIINIIQALFDGYYCVFDAKSLGTPSKDFALEAFKSNPLVAVQHDADLSKIEDNTRLNSLVAHEKMQVNEKHKALYEMMFQTMCVVGSNSPVKITDAKSGLLRRMIDVRPTGNRLPLSAYKRIVEKITKFELGHIAYHCKQVYEEDPHMYDDYIPVDMLSETNDFYNFVEDSYLVFKRYDSITLKEAWEMYKTYCEQAKVQYPFSMRIVKAELRAYFKEYYEDYRDPDNGHVRNLYKGFKSAIFEERGKNNSYDYVTDTKKDMEHINFINQPSILDEYLKDSPAQYASPTEVPSKEWSKVTTILSDIDTKKLHYVKLPLNLIVIDFDIKDENGKKSFEKNLEAASKWPLTYAELSKSGDGIHLHYIYDGDPMTLSRIYDENIEIKIFNGNASLRRKLTRCNNIPIAHISSGLPLRGEKPMNNFDGIINEKAIRTMIKRNMNKEYHGATKPSIDFIYKILEDAYKSGSKYDVSDLYNPVLAFAAGSTNQANYCLDLVPKMHFKSDEDSMSIDIDPSDKPLTFFDCEVFPNLFLLNWKIYGKGKKVTRMINPKPIEIEKLIKEHKLVGFNNRKYDNHIIYGRMIGYNNEQLFNLSQGLILGTKKDVYFGEAYSLSYTDVYDYSSKKQSLKKWEVELGIRHLELGLPWDKPVPKELWPKVSEYCDNDVLSLEAVWDATQEDFIAREILAEIAGMSVNDTTNTLTTKIIFGNNKKPELVYVDLAEEFPGYEFVKTYNNDTNKYDKFNMYRGIDLGLGGYVYAEPGMYTNVALLDVESLHPHSAIAMNAFGAYTKNYEDIVNARMYIKHGEYDTAKKLFEGKLAKYLNNHDQAKKLAMALKIAINSVYGLTSASFPNPFKDPRNENNIVALRGALFMKTLQDEVVNKGFTVAHIKTDSIKIPNATKDIIDFCCEFAKKYGYTFKHEATYDKICLVNDAVYIAKYAMKDVCIKLYGYCPDDNISNEGLFTATGTQFQIPYVFKKCFSHEKITFDDLCEVKQVKTAIYLDFNEGKMDTKKLEQELYVITKGNREPERQEEIKKILVENHDMHFIGRVGVFCPIKPGCGGAELLVERNKRQGDIGYDAVTGTKGYRWLEAGAVKDICEQNIDESYYISLVNEAIDTINKYGSYEWFIS